MKKNNLYSTYHAIDGHPNYYQNQVSLKIIFKKNINGRVVKIPTGKTKIQEAKKEAERILIERLAENPEKEKRLRKGILNPLLSECWQELMDEKEADGRNPNTMEGYRVSWDRSIKDFWADKTTVDVTPQNVKKYEHWYLKNHGDRIFFNTHKHLGMLFRWMADKEYILKAPTITDLDKVIRTNKKMEDVGRVYTDAEIKAIVDNASHERVALAVLIYRYMGCREMEVLSSELSKWDLKKGNARIWSAKNKYWRDVPIPDVIKPRLKDWIASLPKNSKYLFPSPTKEGAHITAQSFLRAWTKSKEAAKIKNGTEPLKARIHDLRHTFATQTAKDNWPPMVACSVLDMSYHEYQRTYVHITKHDIRDMMNQSFAGADK